MSMFLNYIEKLVRCTYWSVSVLSWLSICRSWRNPIDFWRHLSQESFFFWYLPRCWEVSQEAYTFSSDDFVCRWCNCQFCFCSLLVLFYQDFLPHYLRICGCRCGKLAKLIGILHFNIEMLHLRWLCIIILGELIWYFMTSDRLMTIVMVMNDCVWSFYLERFC